jgi:hypothetical protein
LNTRHLYNCHECKNRCCCCKVTVRVESAESELESRDYKTVYRMLHRSRSSSHVVPVTSVVWRWTHLE